MLVSGHCPLGSRPAIGHKKTSQNSFLTFSQMVSTDTLNQQSVIHDGVATAHGYVN